MDGRSIGTNFTDFWYEILIRTELGTEFQWEKINKNVDFRAIFFEIGMEPFIFSTFAPYHVPYQKISYQKSVPRTKIRTGTDFRYGSVVQAGPVMPNWPFKRSE